MATFNPSKIAREYMAIKLKELAFKMKYGLSKRDCEMLEDYFKWEQSKKRKKK